MRISDNFNNISDFESDSEKSISVKKNDDNEVNKTLKKRRVKVFDRFTMILQIFAKRAQTKIARLQVIILKNIFFNS